jgi:hypothetical protein
MADTAIREMQQRLVIRSGGPAPLACSSPPSCSSLVAGVVAFPGASGRALRLQLWQYEDLHSISPLVLWSLGNPTTHIEFVQS